MILKQELLKILKTPVIWVLVLFFITLNSILVMSKSDFKEDLSILSDMVDTYGAEINEEMMTEVGHDYKKIQTWVNQVANDENTVYEHPSDLLSKLSKQTENPLEQEELRTLLEYAVLEGFYRTAQDLDEIYEEIDLSQSAEGQIELYRLTGNAAEQVREQYQKLEVRLDQLIENGEHKHLFFMGKVYEMHSLLFRDIGRALLFELMILIVLITAAITNYEFEHRTSLVTYTTKKGRALVLYKLLAATIASSFVMLGMIGVTLTIFFTTYNYEGLWSVPISNYFNGETVLPYISWWNITFIEYVGFFILFIILSQLIFLGVTFVLSVYMKNTYLVFFTFMIFLGIGILLPSYMPRESNLIFLLNFNPFVFILNPHEWLMGNGPFTISKYYEQVTIGLWIIIIGWLMNRSVIRFKREPLQ